MSEQQAEEETKPIRSYPSPLKRVVITLIGLFIFVVFFGHIVPRLMFAPPKEKEIVKAEKPVEKPAEESVEVPAEKSAEEPIEAPIVDAPLVPTIKPAEEAPQDNKQLHALEEKIAALESAHEVAISELKTKLDARNETAQNNAEAMLSAMVIFGQLKDAVGSGRPYDTELNQLRKFTETNSQIAEIIDALDKNSASGIITLAKIKANFSPLIKQALINKDENIAAKIFHKFITIRKVGEQAGSDDESVLARAEIKLTEDDLSSALSEMEGLTPQAKEIFDDWREDAQGFLDARKNLNKLQLFLIQTEPVSASQI